MTLENLDFLPLKVTHLDEAGRRCFDREDKRRLIEACLRREHRWPGWHSGQV